MEVVTIRASDLREDAADHPILLPHQLAALRRLKHLEQTCESYRVAENKVINTRIGIYGDKPGSGKSYVIAGLLFGGHDHLTESSTYTHHINVHLTVTHSVASGRHNVPMNILVVPHNIVTQWEQVLRLFNPDRSKFDVFRNRHDIEFFDRILTSCYQTREPRVLLTSSTTFTDIVNTIRSLNYNISRLIIDEADAIRITRCNLPNGFACFYWFVTASVHNLMAHNSGARNLTVKHSNGDIVTSLNSSRQTTNSACVRDFFRAAYGMGHVYSHVMMITDDPFIDRSFRLTAPIENIVQSKPPMHTRVLSGIAPYEVMRRLNAGDLETALVQLQPNRADSENNIIAAAIAQLNVALNNAVAELEFLERRNYANESTGEAARHRARCRVERCRRDLANVTRRIQETTECCICYSDIQNKTVLPCCNNSFCLSCITSWVASRRPPLCPLCKTRTSTNEFMVCCPEESGVQQDRSPSSPYRSGGVEFDKSAPKPDNLKTLLMHLASQENRRILFFSDNEYANEHAGEPAMMAAGIEFSALKGTAACINKRIEHFRNGRGAQALLINCNHYGCGMDLSFATDVIIYHAVDARMDRQIVGRAQRPPRSSTLRVWRFVHAGEVV